MDVSRTITEGYKVYLAMGGVALVLLWPLLVARGRQWGHQLLWFLTLLAVANYARWGLESVTERIDAYDLMHYYVNAKYFDEIGYLDLYPCVILADHDNGGPHFDEGTAYMAQDEERGHYFMPITHAVRRGSEVRLERFTPERWAAFEHDVLYLQRERWGGGSALWRQMIIDHGFNGTPAWLVLATPFAQVVPIEWVKVLGYLDFALLAAAVGAVVWAYGVPPALWLVFWLAVSYSLRWPTVTWAFLRYDFVAALILATCFLKKQRPLVAGLFAGWAGVLRLFPAVWMWGPFSKGLAGLMHRTVHKRLLVFAGGFLLAIALVQGAAVARFGFDEVRSHFENMMDHNSAEQLSSRRIGLALALSHDGALEPKLLTRERRQQIDDQKPLRLALGGVFLVIMGFGLRSADDDEAYGFGFLPFFLLTTASYYYYVTRCTMVLVHAADLSRLRNRVGLALLLGIEVFANWAETAYPGHRMFNVGGMAWLLSAYAVTMCVWVNIEAWQRGRRDAESPEAAAAA